MRELSMIPKCFTSWNAPATVGAWAIAMVVTYGTHGWAGYEVPGELPEHAIVLEHATIHPVSSPSIEDGVLVIRKGMIQQIGRADAGDFDAGDDAQRIDVSGKHLYPGLIDADTSLGLIEIDAVRATIDVRETGNINTNVEARIAFQPDSELIPVARAGGVLLALVAPQGGLLSGQSSLMRLDGWTVDEMTLQPRIGMHVNWPIPGRGNGEGLETLKKWLEEARDYARQGTAAVHDARLAALQPSSRGSSLFL